MAKAIEIRDRESLLHWLNNRPKATRRQDSAILASRAALRVLPFIARADGSRESQFARLTMAVFRANTISRIAGTIPTRDITAADAADADAYADPDSYADAYADAAADAYGAAVADAAAAAAAADAAYAASARAAAADDAAAAAAAYAAANAARATADTWSALSADAEVVSHQGTIALLSAPLWPGKTPDGWPDALKRLKTSLSARFPEDHWSVWTDWYESIARGGSAFGLPAAIAAELEKRIALGDGRENFWDRPPAAINAEIAGWVAQAHNEQEQQSDSALPDERSIPAPAQGVTHFHTIPNGQIAFQPDQPEPIAGERKSDQEELYDEAREKALALHGLGANRLGSLANKVEALVRVLPEKYGDASVNRIWSRTSALRSDLLLSKEALKQPEAFRDRSLILESQCASLLEDTIHSLNVFLAFDERGRTLDRLKFGPEEMPRHDVMLNRAAPIIVNIGNIAEGATANIVIGEHNNVANLASTIHGDQEKLRVALQDENFIIAVLQTGFRIARAVHDAGATESVSNAVMAVAGRHGPDIVNFVAEQADHLKKFVELWETGASVVQIIDAIVRVAHMLF